MSVKSALARTEDQRMAGGNLFHEAGAGARHPDDEHRQFGGITPSRGIRERAGTDRTDQPIYQTTQVRFVENVTFRPAALPEQAVCQGVHREGRIVVAPPVEFSSSGKSGRGRPQRPSTHRAARCPANPAFHPASDAGR